MPAEQAVRNRDAARHNELSSAAGKGAGDVQTTAGWGRGRGSTPTPEKSAEQEHLV